MIIYDREKDNFMLATVDMNKGRKLFVWDKETYSNPVDKKAEDGRNFSPRLSYKFYVWKPTGWASSKVLLITLTY